jgi:hypothetical protein
MKPTEREVQKMLWANAINDIIQMVEGDDEETYGWVKKVFFDGEDIFDEDKELIDELLDEYNLKPKRKGMRLNIENFSKLENQLLDDDSNHPWPNIHKCYKDKDEYTFIIHGDFSGRYEDCPSEMNIKLQRKEHSKGLYRLEDYDSDNWSTISIDDIKDVSKFKKKLLDVYTGYYEWDED